MSAIGLQLITVLCLSCTALSGPERGGVVWKDLGDTITIQCRSDSEEDFLNLKKGLSRDDVLILENKSEQKTIGDKFKGRLQSNGDFPNIDILIKNLTSDDTGPYWCSYSMFDVKSNKILSKDGTGSVLLVVSDAVNQCDPPNQTHMYVSIVISAAALLGVFLILIIVKPSCSSCP